MNGTLSLVTYLFVISLIAASISYTVCCAGIFEKLRNWVTKWGHWFEDLIHCPYCFGHYVTLALIAITYNRNYDLFALFTGNRIIDFILMWFACVCIMSIWHFIMVRAYKPVAESETLRKVRSKYYNK